MTIIVAYAPRPEGRAALKKGIEIAIRRDEKIIVVNASLSGKNEDSSVADYQDAETVEATLKKSGAKAKFKKFVRGKSAVEEIQDLVASENASLLVIGLRKRSAVGKLLLGSVAQDLLLTIPCPILAVKSSWRG